MEQDNETSGSFYDYEFDSQEMLEAIRLSLEDEVVNLIQDKEILWDEDIDDDDLEETVNVSAAAASSNFDPEEDGLNVNKNVTSDIYCKLHAKFYVLFLPAQIKTYLFKHFQTFYIQIFLVINKILTWQAGLSKQIMRESYDV